MSAHLVSWHEDRLDKAIQREIRREAAYLEDPIPERRRALRDAQSETRRLTRRLDEAREKDTILTNITPKLYLTHNGTILSLFDLRKLVDQAEKFGDRSTVSINVSKGLDARETDSLTITIADRPDDARGDTDA